MASGLMSQHAIAPARLLRGPGAWAEALPLIPALSRRPLVLGRSAATRPLRQQLASDLAERGLQPAMAELRFDCCELDLSALADQARRTGCDGVLASGGGKEEARKRPKQDQRTWRRQWRPGRARCIVMDPGQ